MSLEADQLVSLSLSNLNLLKGSVEKQSIRGKKKRRNLVCQNGKKNSNRKGTLKIAFNVVFPLSITRFNSEQRQQIYKGINRAWL